MFVKYEELNGLKKVESGSFGTTQSARYKNKTVFVKLFTKETRERLVAEFIISSLLSRAFKVMDDAPDFPSFSLILNEQNKLLGFCSTETINDPTNIEDNSS